MSKALLAAVLALGLAVTACAPSRDRVNKDKLDADIDGGIGGLGTCVLILDSQSGRKVYQYGHYDACHEALPPCETFEIPAALIALDAGVIAPNQTLKWDGSSQPVSAWQVDADLSKAFDLGIGWWFGHTSRQVGPDRYAARLRAFDYGGKTPIGPIDSFWMGPARGGGLYVSAASQANFLRRFFTGALPDARAADIASVAAALPADRRGGATLSGLPASCADEADRSRGVAWWVGRLKSPQRDFTVVAMIESDQPPPGSEVKTELESALADAGLWPPG